MRADFTYNFVTKKKLLEPESNRGREDGRCFN